LQTTVRLTLNNHSSSDIKSEFLSAVRACRRLK